MLGLKSYLQDQWLTGTGDGRALHDATTGEAIGSASTAGLDLAAAVEHARSVGGPALRALTFAERGAILKELSALIHSHRDELLELSRGNGGTTRGDGKFDVDGASGTLAYYASLGRKMGDVKLLLDDGPEPVGRSKRFVGQHLYSPRRGVAVHLNAFNFPAWGMAEKVSAALLAGMPVIAKPGTATAIVAFRIAELWAESGVLPPGSFSFLAGSVGNLLDHLGGQDCIAFTGGSQTAAKIRSHACVVERGTRLNIEADSLNAAVLGPDVEQGSDTYGMFLNAVVRDITQKAGQKCTAVRRIFVPEATLDDTVEALVDRLSGVVVGQPGERGVDVGPVSSAAQQRDVTAGQAELESSCKVAWQADPPSGGYFVKAALYQAPNDVEPAVLHQHEVFGPCATVIPYNGEANRIIERVAAGGGGLVCSVYSDDTSWAGEVVLGLAPHHGRIHWGSRKVHDQSPGPGTVMPNLVHGGPGKAGGGEELGGRRGLAFYWQRTAIQADRGLLDRVLAAASASRIEG